MVRKPRVFPLGLAIFTMFFGAGNVVFPLLLGRATGEKVGYAIAGFFLTAVIVPLFGLIAGVLFEGNYKKFLGIIGPIPGFIAGLMCMALLGPFGATPRCVILAHAAISWYVPSCSLFIFSLSAALIIFLLTLKKGRVIAIFGKVLGPLKLTLLLSIIVLGFLSPIALEPSPLSSWDSFFDGLKNGYFTLDILGAIFFAGLIYNAIASQVKKEAGLDSKEIVKIGLKAGLIGGGLLGLVYIGFCLVAAMYGAHIYDVPNDQLLNALASLILGHKAGVLANITVAVACLTTAMALTAVFADYLSKELSRGKLPYVHALLITSAVVFGMANLGFSGIMAVIEPLALVSYPALIMLAISGSAKKLFGFRWAKFTVYTTFLLTVAVYYGHVLVRFFV